MITRIEALNDRCLRYIRQDLGPFHVLVGPNASGKTTFLDVIAFLGRLVSDGPEAAVVERTQNFQDLVWGRQGDRFELANEASIPQDLVPVLGDTRYETIRYEVAVGLVPVPGIVLLNERVALKSESRSANHKGPRKLFPNPDAPLTTIRTKKSHKHSKLVILKDRTGVDHFYSEWAGVPKKSPAFRVGPRKSALGNLPFDETSYPVATWFKRGLTEGVQQIDLNSSLIRKASPSFRIRGFKLHFPRFH
jgi:AAA domain, putative AbiEii toxin, Type IV TA system